MKAIRDFTHKYWFRTLFAKFGGNTLLDGIAKATEPGLGCPCVLTEMPDFHWTDFLSTQSSFG